MKCLLPDVKKALSPFSNPTRNVEVRYDLRCNNNECRWLSNMSWVCNMCFVSIISLPRQGPMQEGYHSFTHSCELTFKGCELARLHILGSWKSGYMWIEHITRQCICITVQNKTLGLSFSLAIGFGTCGNHAYEYRLVTTGNHSYRESQPCSHWTCSH